jgi:hypothetical protein
MFNGRPRGTHAVTMKIMPNRHPHQDLFEDYAFDRLSGNEAAGFEEHLLICEECQATLAKTDEYIQVMKAATAAYVAGHSRTLLPRRGQDLHWNATFAAILLLTCLTGLLSWRTPGGDPKAIALDSYRGAVNFPQAPAGQPLDLKIDLKDVRPASGYRVEVVDTTGRRVWFGGPPAHLAKGLPKGDYWVRLSTDSGEWLREYGLAVGESRR